MVWVFGFSVTKGFSTSGPGRDGMELPQDRSSVQSGVFLYLWPLLEHQMVAVAKRALAHLRVVHQLHPFQD